MISIIIPTLNEEQVIEKTLTEFKKFTAFDHEIIISDGHSSDKTVEIAKRLANKVVEHDGKTRQNISQGRNAGVKAATGEFLVFMDADTHIENHNAFFSEALNQFKQHPNVVGLTAKIKVLPGQETLGDKLVFGMVNFKVRLYNNILHKGEATGEFQMIRKNAFDSLHGFREDLITREDADMFQRLAKVGNVLCCPSLTVFHSGRRGHKVGWLKLYSIWTINTIWFALFNKPVSKEWKVIR